MCGIVGISSFTKDLQVNTETIKKMCQVLSHRGPDDAGDRKSVV